MSRSEASSIFERIVDRLIEGAASLSEFVVGGLAVLVSLDALLRWLVNWSFLVVDEVGGYAVLLLTFFGMAIALQRDALFRVDAFVQRLEGRTRDVVLLIYELAALGFALVLLWQLMGLAMRSYAREITASTVLRTPLWWPQAMMAVGVSLLVLVLMARIYRAVRLLHGRAPR